MPPSGAVGSSEETWLLLQGKYQAHVLSKQNIDPSLLEAMQNQLLDCWC